MKIPAKDFKIGILMECGCTALGTVKNPGEDEVVGCGLHGCTEAASREPGLVGRKARCSYGGNEVPSSLKLPFFKFCPDRPYDEYYCGCYGWD
jgi:hypothetical protein